MFDHVGVNVTDRPASERFYRAVLGAAGLDGPTGGTYLEWDDFALAEATAERPAASGVHVAFSVGSRELVDAFWRAGRAVGHPDAGAPGPRDSSASYYGAFLRDPDGNSVEAVHRDGRRTDGSVDHLWIRVADVAEARRFYAAVAPHAGILLATDTPGRVSFVRDGPGGGTFSLVGDGPPTRHLHVAFPAPDHATVQAFHAAATGAGFRDNGGPGERAEYHAGYYAAFALDPDGNNVEAVDHGG